MLLYRIRIPISTAEAVLDFFVSKTIFRTDRDPDSISIVKAISKNI